MRSLSSPTMQSAPQLKTSSKIAEPSSNHPVPSRSRASKNMPNANGQLTRPTPQSPRGQTSTSIASDTSPSEPPSANTPKPSSPSESLSDPAASVNYANASAIAASPSSTTGWPTRARPRSSSDSTSKQHSRSIISSQNYRTIASKLTTSAPTNSPKPMSDTWSADDAPTPPTKDSSTSTFPSGPAHSLNFSTSSVKPGTSRSSTTETMEPTRAWSWPESKSRPQPKSNLTNSSPPSGMTSPKKPKTPPSGSFFKLSTPNP